MSGTLGYKMKAFIAAAALLLLAAEPPNTTFSPAPPGTVVQSQLVYLSGEAMHSQWRGVLSKSVVGTSGSDSFYQWYISIYRIDEATYKLQYQSPASGPLEKVTKVDSSMWMPAQSASIVGAGELMEAGVQQLVTTSHESGADCGSETVTIFRYDDKTSKVVPAATVQNGCNLTTKIVTPGSGNAYLLMTGPYYGPNAPMCCPTKNKASATLKYVNGSWVESPKYFTLYQNAFPH